MGGVGEAVAPIPIRERELVLVEYQIALTDRHRRTGLAPLAAHADGAERDQVILHLLAHHDRAVGVAGEFHQASSLP